MDKKTVVILIISILLVGVVLVSLLVNSLRTRPTPDTQIPIATFLPDDAIPPPQVYIDDQKSNQLLQIVKERPSLEEADQNARQKLIDSLGDKSGVLQKTSSYTIEYVKAPNVFQVEITTTSFTEAKQQVSAWFISQGISQAGQCKLPLMFYLSTQAKDQLENQGVIFNPLPEGC